MSSAFLINPNRSLWALGLMSGTSADGIDAALLQTDGIHIHAFGPTHFVPYSQSLKRKILTAYSGLSESEEGSLARALTEQHAEVVWNLLTKANMRPIDVDLIGFHGQTLFHRPPRFKEERGETHTIGDGHLLAALTGIAVIDQFRLNDMAHGGQGAPLVPIFHQALGKDLPKPLVILNLGGVANITWIGARENELLAFDTGPGNGLIDDWVRENTDLPWDEGGKIAAGGQVNHELLTHWLSHSYFTQKPPKSLDRKTFHSCLEDVLSLSFADGVATLTALTAASLEKALDHLPEKPCRWVVAGGGAHNATLLKMIEEKLKTPIQKANALGWAGDALEAQAFAFLAVRAFRNLPLTFPGTTSVPYPLSGGRICKP